MRRRSGARARRQGPAPGRAPTPLLAARPPRPSPPRLGTRPRESSRRRMRPLPRAGVFVVQARHRDRSRRSWPYLASVPGTIERRGVEYRNSSARPDAQGPARGLRPRISPAIYVGVRRGGARASRRPGCAGHDRVSMVVAGPTSLRPGAPGSHARASSGCGCRRRRVPRAARRLRKDLRQPVARSVRPVPLSVAHDRHRVGRRSCRRRRSSRLDRTPRLPQPLCPTLTPRGGSSPYRWTDRRSSRCAGAGRDPAIYADPSGPARQQGQDERERALRLG